MSRHLRQRFNRLLCFLVVAGGLVLGRSVPVLADDYVSLDGSPLSVATSVGTVASGDTTEHMSLEFSPYTTSLPYQFICPRGTRYQLELKRAAFVTTTGAFSPMDVVLSLTPFDMAGTGLSPNCKVTVPMTPGVTTITLPTARNITRPFCYHWEVTGGEWVTTEGHFDTFPGYFDDTGAWIDPIEIWIETTIDWVDTYDWVYRCEGPLPSIVTPAPPGLCNISTNYAVDEFGNLLKPGPFYVNITSHGPNPSAIEVTGQCVSTAPPPPPPPPPVGLPSLPVGCAADPLPVALLNGLGDDVTVNDTGNLVAIHKSFGFTSPGALHTCGVRFNLKDALGVGTLKEVNISTCPNTFTGPAACHMIVADDTTFDLNTPSAGGCAYPAGTTLYLNVRPWPDTSGGKAALSFTSTWLDGTCTPPAVVVPPVTPHVPPTALPPLPVTIAGCAPDILGDMRDSGQTTSGNLDSLVSTLIRIPQGAASFDCMRNLFNVWDTDLLATLGGAIASYFTDLFPFTALLPGITLTEASLYKPIMSMVNDMINKNLGQLVCKDLWGGIAQSMTPVKLMGNGSFSFGATPSVGLSVSVGSATISIP